MKKVFDQTVRDIKREVNKKVLKVPGIEQKVLDATSNEPWGPHGTLLADIAQASRNYHEYQMIMGVVWKRINDTGKNWRHVYKALTVLEYLVANGSERVTDEIREHAYQISTLADFQYIDSSGRDQGGNVRRKSQSLVVLVNDKERIAEVRQKAAANRDKFRNTSAGGMYRPGSYSSSGGYGDRYDDDRYGGRDEDRNGYGREREYNYRDDDRYGRYGDSNSRDGDRYGRDYEDHYSRDGYRDDDYRGRSRSMDGYGPRGRSSDMDRDRAFDDDGQSSSRGSGGGRADDQSQDGSIARRLERKFSEQNLGAPPSYEEAVIDSRSPAYSDRNGETSVGTAPGSSSPPAPTASSPPAPKAASPSAGNNQSQVNNAFGLSASPAAQEVADEFDPRGSTSAAPTASGAPVASTAPAASNNAEMDLLGSLSDVFAPNPLAIMPATPANSADAQTNFSESSFSAAQPVSNVVSQPFDDPFGDSPFKAIPSADTVSQQQPTPAAAASFQPAVNQSIELPQGSTPVPSAGSGSGFDFAEAFSVVPYSAPDVQPPTSNTQFLPQELSTSHQETDILADILPPSGPSPTLTSQPGFSAPMGQPVHPGPNPYGNFNPQMGSAPVPSNMGVQHFNGGNFLPQGGLAAPVPSNITPQTPAPQVAQFNNGNSLPQLGSTATGVSQMTHAPTGQAPQVNNGNFLPQQGAVTPITSQVPYQTPTGPAAQHGNDALGNLFTPGPNVSLVSQSLPSSTGSLAIVPQESKEKFETKSTVWADTLSRGLVNLNISGPKINPLSDIGIDFDAINRKEKRMEKQPPTTTVTSTVSMGKAMGSGSGIGRAGAGALRAPNSMMGSGMGMGAGSGMGMGGYGGMNQPMGMGMGQPMGMNMGMNMGMGMNMRMAHGGQMQTPGGMPPTMPSGYNPMMGGSGGYAPQQPYGGYR